MIHPEGFLPIRDNIVEELWLNNNHIEHSFILKILVDSLPNLRLLDMSNNYLEDLSQGIVQNHLSLEMLILENNKLLKLGRESFVGLPSLRELKLRNNSLAYHLGTPYWNLPALKVKNIYCWENSPKLKKNVFLFLFKKLLYLFVRFWKINFNWKMGKMFEKPGNWIYWFFFSLKHLKFNDSSFKCISLMK